MGNLKYLVLHNAATPPRLRLTPKHITHWHTSSVENGGRGWSRVGYSDLFLRDGNLYNLVPFDQDNEVDYNEMTWGVKGFNGVSRHVCVEGGVTNQNHPISPLEQFPKLVAALKVYIRYTILRHPNIEVAGHYQFDEKKPHCPGYDVPSFLRSIGIPEKNIYVAGK